MPSLGLDTIRTSWFLIVRVAHARLGRDRRRRRSRSALGSLASLRRRADALMRCTILASWAFADARPRDPGARTNGRRQPDLRRRKRHAGVMLIGEAPPLDVLPC